MLFNKHDFEIKTILFVLSLLIICISFIIKTITKSSFCKYLDFIKPEFFSKIIFVLHWTISAVLSLLFSNHLDKYFFYNNIIKQNRIWEYIILIFLFITLLIISNICLNLFFCHKNTTLKKEHKNGSQ